MHRWCADAQTMPVVHATATAGDQMQFRRLLLAAALLAAVFATTPPLDAAAASSSIECGQLSGYAAPDPSGPADGSLQLGIADSWVVLADATISPAAEAALPGNVNSGPTCVALDLDDDGAITALDFAAEGSIQGYVDFDSDSGFYVFEGRLFVPTFITDSYPGLASLFATSYQASSELTVDFVIDSASGAFVGFDGRAAFCGTGSVTSDGDGQVGKAVIPAAVLTKANLAKLAKAGSYRVCAAVHSSGTIDPDTGDIQTQTAVTFDVASPGATVTAPPTSIAVAAPVEAAPSRAVGPALVTVLIVSMVLVCIRRRRAAA